jgi:hypothetical protein
VILLCKPNKNSNVQQTQRQHLDPGEKKKKKKKKDNQYVKRNDSGNKLTFGFIP